jgi:PAS domain S-box-containing protein
LPPSSSRDVRRLDAVQERLLALAIENAPIGIGVVDRSARFVAVNRALCALSGYEREELLELPPIELSADREAAARALRDVISGSVIDRAAGGLRRKDGTVVEVEGRAAPGREADGGSAIVVLWQRGRYTVPPLPDEHRSLSRRQEMLLGVAFQEARVAITLNDGDGRYLAVNPYTSELTGYSPERLFELGVAGVVAAGAGTVRSIEESRAAGTRSGESQIRRADGRIVPVGFAIGNARVYDDELMIAVWWELAPTSSSRRT